MNLVDIVVDTERIKPGTKVKIVHTGSCYTTYEEMAEFLGHPEAADTRTIVRHNLLPGDTGIVLAGHPHLEYCNDGIVYCVSLTKSWQKILVGEKGLEPL